MNLPLLHTVSWQQFCGSLAFAEGWVIPLPLALNRFQSSLIFRARVARLNEQICYQLQGVWAYSCWLITLCKPPSCAPGLASLCLCSSGIPGWSFAWRSLYPGTCSFQLLPLSCATETGFNDAQSTGLQCWILSDEDMEELCVLR